MICTPRIRQKEFMVVTGFLWSIFLFTAWANSSWWLNITSAWNFVSEWKNVPGHCKSLQMASSQSIIHFINDIIRVLHNSWSVKDRIMANIHQKTATLLMGLFCTSHMMALTTWSLPTSCLMSFVTTIPGKFLRWNEPPDLMLTGYLPVNEPHEGKNHVCTIMKVGQCYICIIFEGSHIMFMVLFCSPRDRCELFVQCPCLWPILESS